MPTTNNNYPVDMKQLWQQMEPAVTVSSAISAFTTSEDGNDRFIYYIVGALFYRYDTYGNAWQKLASPPVTPTNFASLRFSKYSGTFSKVISAPSSTTLRIAPINAPFLVGKTIRIIQGVGMGQVRTITASPEPIKYEQGLATTASATQLGDSTKRWRFNQWAGYQARITFSTGVTQVRRILYNDTTTLTFSDTNYQPIDSWNNQGFATAPITTAGSQSHFVIEATDITVAAWDITPDYSSRFKIETGGVWLFTSAAAGAYASLQYYDIAGDFWTTKTVPTSFILAAFGTDGTIERTGEIGGVYQTGTATSGTNYTLVDSSKTFVDSAYMNFRVRITAGTGIGQSRRILSSNATTLEVARKWDTNPDNTSVYEIIADKDKIYMGGNAQAMLLQYDVDSDLIIEGSKYDDGIANVLAARFPGVDQQPIAITSGTRGTGGITTVTINTAGTGHAIGDIITLATGANGKVQVTSISPGGIITGISLLRPGTGYTVTTFAQSATTGLGTGFIANVTAIGTVCNVVTAMSHNFKIGDSVILSGDALYAGTVTIIGCDSLTGFDFATAAAGNMTAAVALSATVTVDSTKSWAINEHVGKLLQTHLVGVAGAVQPRVILSNTATSITTATITTALVNGTGRYVIVSPSALGRDEQRRDPTQGAEGKATGGSLTTLIDTTKNWIPNTWLGYKVRVEAGTGRDITMTVTSNTANTLTYASSGFTPDATTFYRIQDTYGTCTGVGSTSAIVDATKAWVVNQWAGKRLRITGGAGFALAAATNEITITSNAATTLSFTAITGFAPDATTTYTILGTPARGAGVQLVWLFGGTSAGKYMFYPRGGASNTIDRYNIVTEKYEYGFLFSPQTDTMTTGSYYAYDGANRLYYSPGVATGVVQYVYYYNVLDNRAYGFGSVPNTQLAPVIGNRMEIVTSPAGIDYLYHMRNTGAEIYRAQIYF